MKDLLKDELMKAIAAIISLVILALIGFSVGSYNNRKEKEMIYQYKLDSLKIINNSKQI